MVEARSWSAMALTRPFGTTSSMATGSTTLKPSQPSRTATSTLGTARLSPAQVSAGSQASSVSPLLRDLDFTVLDDHTTTVPEELAWRQALWANLQARRDQDGLLSTRDIRAVRAYRGQQGIWVDKVRTEQVHHDIGVAVALNHTGVDYPDDVSEDGMFYHYPVTKRGGHDLAEVNATKAAAELKLPLFAISKRGERRSVRLDGWRAGMTRPSCSLSATAIHRPLWCSMQTTRMTNRLFWKATAAAASSGTSRTRPDQTRFKLKVIQRYGPRCPLSGVEVPAGCWSRPPAR